MVMLGIVVLAGLFWFMNTYIRHFFASIPTAQTEFTPSAPSVQPGDEFSINIQLSGETITAADVYITYMSDKVQYPADLVEPESGFAQLTDYFDSPPFIEEVINTSDTTKTLHLVLVSEKGDSDVAQFSLKFKALAVGNATFTIDRTQSKLSGSIGVNRGAASYIGFPEGEITTSVLIADAGTDPTNTPTLSPSITPQETAIPSATLSPEPTESPISPSPTLTPTPTTEPATTSTLTPSPSSTQTPSPTTVSQNSNVTLDMKVRLQGVVKQPVEAYRTQTMKVLVQSTDKSFRQEQSIPFTVNGDAIWTGTMKLANVPIEKSFAIYVKGPKHLRRKICSLTPTENIPGQYVCEDGQIKLVEGTNVVDMSNIYVLAGDLPVQNGIVDAVDIIYVRNNLGSTNPSVLSHADLNLDGIVDTQDYTLTIVALGFKYDEK